MAEKTLVTMSGPTSKTAQNRKLGMDKPCSQCGSPIYFNYSGPLDGICGKCTDVLRRRLAPRQGAHGHGLSGQSNRRRGFGWISITLAFLAGAAAATIAAFAGISPF
jgi:hypothetical protein